MIWIPEAGLVDTCHKNPAIPTYSKKRKSDKIQQIYLHHKTKEKKQEIIF